MNPGYHIITLEGLDLSSALAQDIDNSHLKAGIAYATGKPLFLAGVSGYGPIPATISQGASNAYILTFLTYTASVATTDKVTVTDLLSD